ncbi:N-acetyltransferase DgcN [Afifella sp. IM 167]|uniref:N-acetyltransferase DgcN n=1 Tax=Afifella sp. IM 167 TaxID=2033586 RepID=UPI001CCAEC18|nr:N-acetyltransferase DgcN [Afifella sp. IM 167]MBZ8135304.1 EBNA-1 nuclear protein [Afifella sp. IM 167]
MIERPYLVFLGDVPDRLAAKTAYGIVDWRRDWCIGQLRLPGCNADTGLPDMGIAEAAANGARSLVIGAVNPGGTLPEHWVTTVVEAIEAGMNVASGLHVRLGSIPAIREAAERKGATLHDTRHADRQFATGKGTKRPGKRLLTVGTDCSVGKKYAALAIDQELLARGASSEFCATGQTGVMIAGRGVAIDAVIADFISGAAEWISPAADPGHWQIVEGQGSLFHPSFAGVSLGLLHGAQPDAFVVCHEPTRTKMRNVETPIATIDAVIEETVRLGRLTNPDIRAAGICINTSALDEAAARKCLDEAAERYGLPAADPIRTGVAPIVEHLLANF